MEAIGMTCAVLLAYRLTRGMPAVEAYILGFAILVGAATFMAWTRF